MPEPSVEKVAPADDMEVLAGGDEKKEEEVVEEVVEEEVVEEEEEVEEEVEGEKEEEKIDLGPRRPSFKDIKAKYPDLFKDFPDLREAFFRETEYTKIFPTVEEAREAVEELTSLSTLRDKVLEGDFATVLESAKEASVDSYEKLVDNLLPALYKEDQAAFMRAITPSIENMLRSAYKDGAGSGNEDLQNSALHISQWFFGTDEVATGKTTTVKKSAEPTEKETRLAKEREEFEATKFRDALNTVVQDRDVIMEREILRGLDPDSELSPYIRKKLVKDVIEEIDKAIQKDSSHVALMNSKWRRAKQEGYSRDSLRRIVSAYQARAKSLVPSVRARLKAEALGKTVSGKKAENVAALTTRKEVPAGVASSSSSKRLPSPKEIDWAATSDADILEGNIKTKPRR